MAVATEEFPLLSSAARSGDIDTLRELLSAGVDVDHVSKSDAPGVEYGFCLTPLQHVCKSDGRKNLEGRVACVKLLIERGACVDAGAPGNPGQSTDTHTNLTPLMYAVLRCYLDIVKILLSAGSDVNVLCTPRMDGIPSSALKMSALSYTYMRGDPRDTDAIVAALLKAGADANPAAFRQGTVMDFAIAHGRRRIWPLFLRAGAILTTGEGHRPHGYNTHRTHPYLQKIETAGGFKAYEKAHRTRLLATFTPKFTHLVPEELVPFIVDFSFHVGFYVSAAAVAALPWAVETSPNQDA